VSVAFYRIKPGDQVFEIFAAEYGAQYAFQNRDKLVKFVLAHNPGITNIDLIYPGEVLVLPVHDGPRLTGPGPNGDGLPDPMPPSALPEMEKARRDLKQRSEREITLLEVLNKTAPKFADAGLSAFLGETGKAARAMQPQLRSIIEAYDKKSAGDLTRGQYDYARRKGLNTMSRRMGSLEKLFVNSP